MLDDYPKTKLVGVSLIVIVVTILVFIYIHQNSIRNYLNKNWKEIRCNPYILPLAGLADNVKGTDYMDKVNTNFNNCMNTNLQTVLKDFLGPFYTLMGGIFAGLKRIGNSLNSAREVISSVRTLFQAFIGTTIDKLSNSYAALIYLREKMKMIIKRQVAIIEIINQFLKAFPFIFYSLGNGPLPRFVGWLSKYFGVLIAVIAICLLCVFGGPFVAIFACPICALCFTKDSIIGVNKYRKKINDICIGDKLDEKTYVTGIILIKANKNNPFEIYRINDNCALTGSHCIMIDKQWKRMNELNIEPEEYTGDLICLITNNNLIPTDEYIFKDYFETDDPVITIRQMDTIKNDLNNNYEIPKNNINERSTTIQGFSYETIRKIITNEDNLIYGYININDPNVEWYDYNGLIITANQLILENDKWIRAYESKQSKLIESDDTYIYNVISVDGILNLDGYLLRDFIEVHNKDTHKELLRQLDNYHNK